MSPGADGPGDHAPRDDLGHAVTMRAPARRVVSLVPSLTEAIALTAPGTLVGATQWCTHPSGLDVARVRGTKNPDLSAVAALEPDLVVANQEENRRLDVDRLRAAGVPVWVTRIDSVDEAIASLRRLFATAFGIATVGWLDEAERVWRQPPRTPGLRVAVPIWRDPWMAVGAGTYVNDVLHRLGWTNVVTSPRYPRVEPATISAGADAVLLPDEPYPFTADDGPEAFAPVPATLIAGRDLSWYGPAMVSARARLEAAAERAGRGGPGSGGAPRRSGGDAAGT